MKHYINIELEAYRQGIDAAYNLEDLDSDSPYNRNSKEDKAWWDGFGDGVEDSLWDEVDFNCQYTK